MDTVPSGQESAVPAVRLTIAYSTLAARAAYIELPAMQAGQEVLIIVQNPDGISHPAPPERQDVRALLLEGKGVAKSRNAAIANARGQYLVFADDDIVFDLGSLETITAHFEQCECSLVLGQAVDPDGVLRKKYPTEAQWLNRFNSGRAATYEMVVRLPAIKMQDIRFDENFGAGATNYLGDEYIFIADMVKRGLKAHFLPVTMAVHPTESSGSGWGTREDLRARSVIFSRVFGPLAFVMRAAFIIRHRDKVSGLGDYVRFTFGAFR